MKKEEIIKEFREKFCRLNKETKEREPKWFFPETLSAIDVEKWLISKLETQKKWKIRQKRNNKLLKKRIKI